MRTRSEAKRREIVETAAALFGELGYERASMSAISERLGGSKATLYGYFASKEELLRAVLVHDVSEGADALLHDLDAEEDLHRALVRFGVDYLTRRLSPLPISNLRSVATQLHIGEEFYATVLRPAWERLARRLAELMDRGQLRRADPWRAAMDLKGLNEAELFEKRLLGAIGDLDPREIEANARHAAEAFLMIYGDGAASTDMTAKRGAR